MGHRPHPWCRAHAASLALAVLLGLGTLLALGAPAHAADRCATPHDLLEDDGDLSATAAAVAQRHPIRIVAIGSAATAGVGASDPRAAFPMRLQTHLATRLSGHAVSVVNKAAARQTAAEMLVHLEADVLSQRPTLVLWEAGTVDAVRGVELDGFSRTLNDGIARLKAAGIDVILIDPQYSPRTMTLTNLPPYLDAVHMVADGARVELFRRFDIMRHWLDNGRFDLSVKPPALTAEIDAIYDCIGRLLAQKVVERLIADGITGLR